MKKLSSIKKPAFHAHTHWDSGAPTRILFVRHGETEWNVKRIIQGWIGTGLNAIGMKQARLTARRIKRLGLKCDVVLSSDLKRAKQTATVIASALGQKIKVWKEWRERGFGAWEGKTIEQVLARYALGPKQRRDPFLAFDPPGGEAMPAFGRRMEKAISRVEREHKGRTVVVVTHGGPMRISACLATGIPLKKYFLLGRPGNSSLSLLCSQGGVRWIEFYNDTSHLEIKRG